MVAAEAQAIVGRETAIAAKIDIRDRAAIRSALDATVTAFGGIDILVNTAALFPSSPDGVISDAQWGSTLEVNVTANYLLADEAAKVFDAQGSRPQRADQFGECGGGQARQRSLRRQQSCSSATWFASWRSRCLRRSSTVLARRRW